MSAGAILAAALGEGRRSVLDLLDAATDHLQNLQVTDVPRTGQLTDEVPAQVVVPKQEIDRLHALLTLARNDLADELGTALRFLPSRQQLDDDLQPPSLLRGRHDPDGTDPSP